MITSIFRNTLIISLFLSWAFVANAEETVIIKLKGDDFNLQETDLSHLAIGESEVIYTESGKELTLTRTEKGVEVLVDGEEIAPMPDFTDVECNIEVIVDSDCEDCAHDAHEMVVVTEVDSNNTNCLHEDSGHAWVSDIGEKHIIKRIKVNAEDGDVVHEVKKHMIIIHEQEIETID